MVRTRRDGGCAHCRTWNLELGVRDSEFLSVVRSTADGLREACGALWMSIPTQTGFSRYTTFTKRKLNWHCAELLEVYTNIAKLKWFEQILPGNSIEQLGLDIVRRLITADIERYYQITIQERENYGELPRSDNLMDLLFLKHLHPLTTIMPDHSHVTELLDDM